MTEQNTNPQPSGASKFRSRTLLGTALALVLGGAVVGTGVIPPQTPAFADPVQVQGVAPISFADVVDKVRPAVVSVRVKSEGGGPQASPSQEDFPFFDLPPGSPMEKFFEQFREQNPQNPRSGMRPSTSVGSGFFISEDGYVVTNNHVVEQGDDVVVVLDDGTEFEAEVIGSDDRTDLALLKVEPEGREFTYVKFADGEVRVGDWVVAVGNPFGLGGTVTAGIISASGRQIGAGPYDDFIQIDAAVNRGNSGGPAFNFQGEVIGVNTAIFSPSGGNVGIAFAIPANLAQSVIADLKEHGEVVRGWLGVQIQPVTPDIADSLRLEEDKGALVAEAQENSPAAAAGIESGDTILAVNGKEVEGPRELATAIADFAPGTDVQVTYWRDGERHDVEIELGTLPDEQQRASLDEDQPPQVEPSSLEDFGMSIAPADDREGVIITDVDPNGQAAERGLQPGDVILSVGDTTVSDPEALEKTMTEAREGGLKAVLLRVQSGDQTRFVALSFARA